MPLGCRNVLPEMAEPVPSVSACKPDRRTTCFKMMTFDDVFAFSIFLRAELLSNEYLLRTENSVQLCFLLVLPSLCYYTE